MMGMCYLHGQLQLLQDVIKQERLVLSGLRIAELGNQLFRDSVLGHEVPAKRIFEALGAVHVSFDTNGKDGALPLDLSEPLPAEHHGAYDLVTNFGTSEHVAKGQWRCWRNIHLLCRPGGLMIHGLPEIGSWPGHGHWHYDMGRMTKLAWKCDWHLRITRRFEYQEDRGRRRLKHSLMLCFRQGQNPFPTEAVFREIMFPEGQPWF